MAVAPIAKQTKVYLPSTENEPDENNRLWVVLADKLFLGEALPALNAPTEQQKEIAGIACMIREWNFQNPDGSDIELNLENINKYILMKDFRFLVGKFYELLGLGASTEEKKTSSATLTPPTTATPVSPTQ